MPETVYTCGNCGFIFSRISDCGRCPDCGKSAVRLATKDEIKEFENRKKEKWEDDK